MYYHINPTEVFRERELALLKEGENRRLARRLLARRVRFARAPKARSTIAAAVVGFLAALVVASLMLAASSSPAHAATTFTVNSTGDQADVDVLDEHCDVNLAASGDQCTLRAALTAALFADGVDAIHFNIPGSGVHTIKPSTELVTGGPGVLIDGYSQPGASPNTLAKGTNAVLKIELNGSAAQPQNGGEASGLHSFSSATIVKGLVINNFKNNGITISGGQNSKVEGNFIGTDPSGTTAKPNTNNGVLIEAADGLSKPTNNIVGGTTPAARNLISGNFGAGVSIEDPFTDLIGPTVINNRVVGNLIGTDKNGTGSLGNGHGVFIGDASSNTVGGAAPGEANTIAFNSPAGVTVSGNGVGNRVLSNSIFSNVGMGIDLGRDGVTANDFGDADSGPNNLQNKPAITSAKTVSGKANVQGKLNSLPNRTFTIEFFASPKLTSSATVQGKTFLGKKTVTTGRKASVSFTFKPARKVRAGKLVTATATDVDGNTSEFSAARKVVAA